MKNVFTFLFIVTATVIYGQCATVTGTLPTLISGSGDGSSTANSYQSGSVIEYCFTITDYDQVSLNWVHSAIPVGFPAGSTIAPETIPASGGGDWLWVGNSSDPNFITEGFYYDSNSTDGNPFNNFGEDCVTCNLTFCFQVTLPSSGGPYTFMPMIDVNGDGTTGSWNNDGCDDDPVTPTGWPTTEFALPIDLLTFNVRLNKGMVELDWSTSNEENFSHFEVEWSKDAKQFQWLSKVESDKSQWIGKRIYQWVDTRVSIGPKKYYRLKMLDYDGRYTYSPIETVTDDLISEVTVYPNPVEDVLHINTGSKNKVSSIHISNSSGVELFLYPHGTVSDNMRLQVADISTGIYFIRIETENGQIHHRKFYKK